MPAMEVVEAVSHKKSKKSKKMKKEVVEEQEEVEATEVPVEDDDTNGHALKKELKQIIEEGVTEEDEENLTKKSKKKKGKKGGAEENGHDGEQEAANGNGHTTAQTVTVDDESINKVVKQIQEVSDEIVAQFKTHAEKLAKKNKGDATASLAAAIAVMSGATRVITTSILTGREGYTTYKLTKYDDEIRGKSFAFVIVKKVLGEEEGDAAVTHLKFTADRKSLVFDIPSSYDEMIATQWRNTKSLEMEPLVGELPPLEEGGGSGGGGGGGGFGGARRGGGDRGRGGRGGSSGGDGCFKCGEKGHFSRECPTGGGGGGGGGDGCFKCGEKGHFSRECPTGGGSGRGRGGFGGGRGRGGPRGGSSFGAPKRSFGGSDGGSNKKIKFDEED